MPGPTFHIPRYRGPDMALQQWSDELAGVLEAAFQQAAQPAAIYTTTHVTPSHTLDATAATLAELRQVVGTMIQDLQSKGSFA